MAMNVEKSREVRQWFKLAVSTFSTGVMFDYIFNDGKGVHKLMDKTLVWKQNFVKFKAKVKDKIHGVTNKISKLTEKSENSED